MIKKLLSISHFYGLEVVPIIFREIIFQFAKRIPGIETLIAKPFNFEIEVPVKIGGIGRPLYVLRGREADHKWMMDQEISPGNTIFDLGANIGYYALMESKLLNRSGKIFAVEPDPRNVLFFKKNIKRFHLEDIISLEEAGISDVDGELDFMLSNRTNLSSFGAQDEIGAKKIKVTVFNFSNYIKKLGKVDLVRMDVEGHEVEILSSLCHLVDINKDLAPKKIIFETHEYYEKKDMFKIILANLLDKAYRVKYISSDDELYPQGSVFKKYGYQPFLILKEWGVSRGIYKDLRSQDAIELISNHRGTRTVCLELVA